MLQDRADELGLELNPKIIMIDFELAAIKAFKRTFPSAEIKGCFFHFSKAIYQHAVSLGFKSFYTQNTADFRRWLCFFICFAFLPLNEIDESFDELLEQ